MEEVEKLAFLKKRLCRYFIKNPRCSTGKLYGWIASIRKYDGFHLSEFDRALKELRDDGVLVCTNGNWWKPKKSDYEPRPACPEGNNCADCGFCKTP